MNDKSGKKGAQNQDINRSLAQAKDPLTQSFVLASMSSSKDPGYLMACNPDQLSSLAKVSSDVAEITRFQNNVKMIKKECIEASLQREVGNHGYSCLNKTRRRFENAGKSAPCLNQNSVDFIHYSVNRAINCLSSGRDPIDPRFILKKINNETAFNFHIAYNGGVGMGQLTSNPVKELAGWKEGNKFIEGNGFHILEDLMKSKNPACQPFKNIVREDLIKPPPLPGNPRNYCDWVSPGQGVARNLIYALGYYIHIRDNVIKPAVESRSKKLATNQNILNYLTLVAYGPDGPSEAKSLIRKLRLNNGTSPGEAISRIVKSSGYVKQTEEKMNELLEELKPGIKPSAADKKGDTCIK